MIDEQENGDATATAEANRIKDVGERTNAKDAERAAEIKAKRERKTSVKVSGKKSAFQRWFIGLRDAEGGKEAANLVRKTEEGKLTIVIKGYPKEFTLESVCELAEEVGLKATIKSETGVGNYEGTVTKTLAEDSASGFLEYAND